MMINVMISSTETEAVSVDVHGAEPKPPADARWMRTPNSKGRATRSTPTTTSTPTITTTTPSVSPGWRRARSGRDALTPVTPPRRSTSPASR